MVCFWTSGTIRTSWSCWFLTSWRTSDEDPVRPVWQNSPDSEKERWLEIECPSILAKIYPENTGLLIGVAGKAYFGFSWQDQAFGSKFEGRMVGSAALSMLMPLCKPGGFCSQRKILGTLDG